MKWLVLVFFAITFITSLLWIEAKERQFTVSQRTLLAATTIVGWAIVLFLGYVAV